MGAVVVDTHAAIWYLFQSKQLSSDAMDAMDEATESGDPVYLASISYVEVIYLVEKGKLPNVALERLNESLDDLNAGLVLVPLDQGVAQAVGRIPRDTVPDMPDRIITATASYLRLPLITRDSKIRAVKGIKTIW
ncbi:MAG: type II toxin-antitoxin system VapC family toxin [Chloroflexi bacterium]|nr:type II toxin-antitoxin system VapC family toxin [Chloroflexota bacterium]MBU1662822.1 type II toxin-antitoxin system VapC family toxin [Chloroflexota bacterium]